MLFKPELDTIQLPALLNQFFMIAGHHQWKKHYQWINQQLKRNIFLREYIDENFIVELALQRLARKAKEYGEGMQPSGLAEVKAASFVAGLVMIHERLPKLAKFRLRGSLRDGLIQHAKGLRSLVHETVVAVHLMDAGFDVTFTDLEAKGRFDFLAKRATAEIEVECKLINGDAGRKVPRPQAAEVYYHIHRETAGDPGHRNGMIIQILLPDRLEQNEQIKKRIASAAVRTIRTGIALEDPGICSTAARYFEVMGSPFDRRDPAEIEISAARDFFVQQTGAQNPSLFMSASKSKAPIIVSIESLRPDALLETMFDTLTFAAKKQLTGTRAGALCVQMHDLSEQQLLDIARRDTTNRSVATGLQLAASRFLDDREHVHTLAFRSHGEVQHARFAIGSGIREQGAAYAFRNPRNAKFKDPEYLLFSASETV